MGRTYDEIDDHLAAWIAAQPVYFIGTAPNGPDSHINISPKGASETFRLLGPRQCAYLDLVGSGAETIAHLRENGRIVVMFCAFDGPPKVVRLHGTGRSVHPGDAVWDDLLAVFDPREGLRIVLRSFIVIDIARIADACGFVVPKMALVEERTMLEQWADAKQRQVGDDWKASYVAVNNRHSIDGLPAIDADDPGHLDEIARSRASSAGKSL